MKYISYIERFHYKDMEKETQIDSIVTMKAAMTTNLSNEQIEFMIYGIRAEAQLAYCTGLTQQFQLKYKL
jgi:hypothetical protein